MKDLKSRLLSPSHTPQPLTLLGTAVNVRRLSAFELAEFEDNTEKLRQQNDSRALALAGASLVLCALVDEHGMPVTDLPTPEELIRAHSPADLLSALSDVQRHSYGTLEEAKKN